MTPGVSTTNARFARNPLLINSGRPGGAMEAFEAAKKAANAGLSNSRVL